MESNKDRRGSFDKQKDSFRKLVRGIRGICVLEIDKILSSSLAQTVTSSIRLKTKESFKQILDKETDDDEVSSLHGLDKFYDEHDDEEEVRPAKLAPFFKNEIVLGSRLAHGSFADIYEIQQFSPRPTQTRGDTSVPQDKSEASIELSRHKIMARMQVMEESLPSPNNENSSFVVKHLKQHLMDDPKNFHTAAVGLAKEAELLSTLEHSNILSLRGISAHGLDGYVNGHHDGYFLILDRLYETLQDKIKIWQNQQKLNRNKILSIGLPRSQRTELMIERLGVLTGIASGLRYMHKRNIIHRDLKLSNFSFDCNGNIKIIDLGLARELPVVTKNSSAAPCCTTIAATCPKVYDETYHLTGNAAPCCTTIAATCPKVYDETYHLTGNVGTMRYMAPEVMKKEPYNAKADIYSFALVVYTTMALKEKPYPKFTTTPQLLDQVVDKRKRPPLPFSSRAWPSGICRLIEAGWLSDFSERPTAMAMHHTLKHALREEKSSTSLLLSSSPATENDKIRKIMPPTKTLFDLDLSTRKRSRCTYKRANGAYERGRRS